MKNRNWLLLHFALLHFALSACAPMPECAGIACAPPDGGGVDASRDPDAGAAADGGVVDDARVSTDGGAPEDGSTPPEDAAGPRADAGVIAPTRIALADVRFWTYNIQDVQTARQREALLDSSYDLYVLEVSSTERGMEDFDIAGLVSDIRAHGRSVRGIEPIVLAYVDVGQAEDWRWYYDPSWTSSPPSWILGDDPNGWEGNYPVAYWDEAWRDIVFGGSGRSQLSVVLEAGFDGLYMDWIEAFSYDPTTAAIAAELGVGDSEARAVAARRMLDFIAAIRHFAREESPRADPGFLMVAQNASDLYAYDPARYRALMDAIAVEAIWYDGDGGFDDWSDREGYNVPTNALYAGWTEEVLSDLSDIQPHMPVFCVEYAQDHDWARSGEYPAHAALFSEPAGTHAYGLAMARGFIPYVTRRSLARLSSSPLPPGYAP